MSIQRRCFLLATSAALGPFLSGCGGGGQAPGSDPAPEPAPKTPSVDVITFGASGASRARIGTRFSVDNAVSNGKLVEQLVGAPGERTRLFFDADGRVQAVRLEDGTTMRFSYPVEGRVDAVAADAGGVRRWGLALYEEEGRLRAAPLGEALTGQQINAELSGSLQGSLTVSADPTDPLAGVDRSRSQALSASLVDALMGDIAVPAGARPGTARALSAGRGQIARGILSSGVLGATLVAAGYFLPSVVAGTAAAPLAAVGAALLIGAGAYAVASGVADILSGGVRALSEEGLDEAAADGSSSTSVLDRIRSGLDAMRTSGQALAGRALDVIRAPAGASDAAPVQAGLASLPEVSGSLAAVASRVRGALVDTAGRLFTGAGTLGAGGDLALDLVNSEGTRARVEATRSGPNVTGSYTVGAQQGPVSGEQRAVGACNASSNSGGAGAFSYSYNVGRSSGTFPFSYDMYSVPDQARIIDLQGHELFNTGGVVRGSASVNVALQGEANVVVLINAPSSGTAWNFTIGCAS